MAFEFCPTIVIDPVSGKSYRQSKRIDQHGRRKYRRARQIFPGLWFSYRNNFLRYPADFCQLPNDQEYTDFYKPSLAEIRMRRELLRL